MKRNPFLSGWPFRNPPNSQFTLNTASPQASGLVAWWPLGLGQYSMLRDIVGGRDFVPSNGPWLKTSTPRGIATAFDVNTYLTADSPITTTPYTMMCWFNRTGPANVTDLYMLGIGDVSVENSWALLEPRGTQAGDPLTLFRLSAADGTDFLNTTTGFIEDTWHHGCAVAVGDNNVSVFIDGGGKGTDVVNTNAPNGWNTVRVGTSPDSSPSAYLDGMVADVRIYNRALSDAEVYEIYANKWELYKPVIRFWEGYTTEEPTALAPNWKPFRSGWPFRNPPNTQFTLNTASPQAKGLVAWWPTLDNPAPSVIQDRIAGLNLSAQDTPNINPDPVAGLAADLAEDGYWTTISTSAGSRYDPSIYDGFTVSVWALLDSAYVNGTGYGIASRTISNWDDADISWLLYRQGFENSFQFTVGDGVNPEVEANSPSFTAGKLHHVVAKYDGTNITCFLDGVPGTPVALASVNSVAAGLSFGSFLTNGQSPWLGKLADFRYYMRALSDVEIYSLWNPQTRWELYAPVPRIFEGVLSVTVIGMEVVWGHDTAVLEANVRDFDGNWTGTGEIINPGTADTERLELATGEDMISEVVNTGAEDVLIDYNVYELGDDVNLDYRHGSTAAACEVASWNDYTVPFTSLGFVQVKVTSTL